MGNSLEKLEKKHTHMHKMKNDEWDMPIAQ